MKFIATIAASLALASAAVAQEADRPVTTIIIDTREICYTGKYADAQRDKANRKANQIARQLRREGKEARIVKLDGRIRMASFGNGPNVYVAAC